MRSIMEKLRNETPKSFNNTLVVMIDDYKTSLRTSVSTGEKQKITLPVSDVLVFWLKDGSRLVIRPSGTEPKIKLYGEVSSRSFKTVEEGIKECDERVTKLLESLKKDLS
jgi:phosphomannomutase